MAGRQGETDRYIALCRLQDAYADAVTCRAWSEFDDFFLPDATVRVDTVTTAPIDLTGPHAVAEFIAGAIERFEFFEFVILNRRVYLNASDDTARARVFTCELRQETATGHWTNTFGVYHDRYAWRDARWWFARRHYQSLARTGRAVVFPFPRDADTDMGKRTIT
jgi:hypothetical protein